MIDDVRPVWNRIREIAKRIVSEDSEALEILSEKPVSRCVICGETSRPCSCGHTDPGGFNV